MVWNQQAPIRVYVWRRPLSSVQIINLSPRHTTRTYSKSTMGIKTWWIYTALCQPPTCKIEAERKSGPKPFSPFKDNKGLYTIFIVGRNAKLPKTISLVANVCVPKQAGQTSSMMRALNSSAKWERHLSRDLPSSVFASFITSLIDDDGHLLNQMGVDETCARIINSLHNGAWFQLAWNDKAIVTRTGGRQGCKLGADVFNLIYSIALMRVRQSRRCVTCS